MPGHNLTFNFDVPYGKELPSITDISKNAHTITKNGDVKHTSEVKVLGESSLYFDGNGDHLKINQNSILNLNGDFTLEGWFYFIDTPADPSNNKNSYGVITCWPKQLYNR